MRLLKWLQKKGSVGSIVRTVIKQYKLIKKQNTDFDDDDILREIFEKRYQSIRPKPSEQKRYIFAIANSEIYNFLKTLSMAIINIEMDVSYSDGKVYKSCSDIVDEEIQRLM